MAVRIICDVCDRLSDPDEWMGLMMTIPGAMLGTFDGEELEIHVCSWECVFSLAHSKVPGADRYQAAHDADPETADLVYDREEALAELIAQNAQAGAKAEAEMSSPIAWGNNPDAGKKQPDVDIPLGGITKDRQQIRLRRK